MHGLENATNTTIKSRNLIDIMSTYDTQVKNLIGKLLAERVGNWKNTEGGLAMYECLQQEREKSITNSINRWIPGQNNVIFCVVCVFCKGQSSIVVLCISRCMNDKSLIFGLEINHSEERIICHKEYFLSNLSFKVKKGCGFFLKTNIS